MGRHNDVRDDVACSIEIMATFKTEKSKVSPFQNLLFSFSVRTYLPELGRVKRIWYLSPMRAAKVQASSYKQWVKRNLQTETQIPDPSECSGMRS